MSRPSARRGNGPLVQPHDQEALAREVESLTALDLHDLRTVWRQRLRTPPPKLTRPLLLRWLAYKLQARVWGDLDGASAKILDQLARDHAQRRDTGQKLARSGPPTIPAVGRVRRLMPGTMLVRHHDGVHHRVVVLADGGYQWDGRRFRSLSEIARAITGTRWSGPRFFGLRDKVAAGAADGGSP